MKKPVTKVVDKGYAAIRQQIAAANGMPYIKAGFLEGKKGDDHHDGSDDLTVTDVALFNEFGTETSPERAFLRETAAATENQRYEIQRKLIDQFILRQITFDQILDRMGVICVAIIKKAITGWSEPPNAPSTVAKKGANNPLVDSGQMRASVEYEKVRS